VLTEIEHPLRQRKLVVWQTSCDGKQHGEPPTHGLGRIQKAFEIEVDHLMTRATPTTDEAPAFGHHPQQISTGRIAELPVRIGS
jgi:hypothetical protein